MLNVQKTTVVQKSYTGETGRGLVELLIDPNGRDKKYPTFKHAVKKNHKPPSTDEFRVIDRRYNNHLYKKKIAESLLIKEHTLSLKYMRSLCH